MKTLIRRRVLRRLIWVCTVCLCPKNGTLGFYGLIFNILVRLQGDACDNVYGFNPNPECCHIKDGSSFISVIGFFTWKSTLPPELEHLKYKYNLSPTIIIETQWIFPVQLCNMGLATVVP